MRSKYCNYLDINTRYYIHILGARTRFCLTVLTQVPRPVAGLDGSLRGASLLGSSLLLLLLLLTVQTGVGG